MSKKSECGSAKNAVHRTYVARKRNLVMEDPDLGRITDKAMARRHGVSHTTAFKARKYAGIPATQSREYAGDIIMNHPDLGKMSDMALSKKIGCAETTVRRHRNLADIPSFAGGCNVKRPSEVTKLMAGWGR